MARMRHSLVFTMLIAAGCGTSVNQVERATPPTTMDDVRTACAGFVPDDAQLQTLIELGEADRDAGATQTELADAVTPTCTGRTPNQAERDACELCAAAIVELVFTD